MADKTADFAGLYLGMYSGLTIVERRELTKLIDEQDLYPDRLSAETRARIRELFGVQFLALGRIYTADYGQRPFNSWSIMLRIVNAETGEIIANQYARDVGGKLSDATETLIKQLCSRLGWVKR